MLALFPIDIILPCLTICTIIVVPFLDIVSLGPKTFGSQSICAYKVSYWTQQNEEISRRQPILRA